MFNLQRCPARTMQVVHFALCLSSLSVYYLVHNRCTNSSMHDCEETLFFQLGPFSSVIDFSSSYFDICPSAKCVLRTTFVFCNCKDKNIDIYLYSTCFSNNLHQGTGARGMDLPLPFFLTFYIQIYFQ